LAKLFDQVRPGDTVVVWRLDRLGRSLRHLIDTVNALSERKVGFRSLTENIDTTTSGGKLVFHIFWRPGRVRAGADPRADQRRPGRRSGSGPPWRAPYGDAPGQGGHRPPDVRVEALHRRSDRQGAFTSEVPSLLGSVALDKRSLPYWEGLFRGLAVVSVDDRVNCRG
jgi:hypothetical protein